MIMSLHSLAPAKINLYLHITGKREDGYHLLDSLVAFTNLGDELRLEPADAFSLSIEGPMAPQLAHEPVENNLITRAAQGAAKLLHRPLDVKLTLIKKLPIASGIGGGSSDAAAALRLLAQHWEIEESDPRLYKVAASLGQDVPCCIAGETCYFRDIGNVTDPGPELPFTDIVLVNPNKSLPTPAVYKAREGAFQPAAQLEKAPADVAELASMLAQRQNGLTDAASQLMPEIQQILGALEQTSDCLLARMSGSGASCFGIYAHRGAARTAAAQILTANPDWWVVPAFVGRHQPSL